jgi:hypothetical protein
LHSRPHSSSATETVDRPFDVIPVPRRAGDDEPGAMFYRAWLALHGYTLDDGYTAGGVDLRFGGAGGRAVHVSQVLDELIIRRGVEPGEIFPFVAYELGYDTVQVC